MQGAAEATVQTQAEVVSRVCAYLARMQNITLKPVAFVEHVAYDSTPAKLQVPSSTRDTQAQRVKLYAVLSEFLIIVRLLKDPAATLADDSLLVLRIPVTPACRIGERGTAECILNVLRSVAKIPVHLETLFQDNVFRVAESDEDAACLRAERIIPGERDRVWSDSGLHVICAAHKLHSSAVKTWHLFPSCLTGMVHVYKCLQDSDLLDVVRRKAIGAIETKLQIFKTGAPPEPAEHFKRHMMRLFLPSRRKPRRYAIIWHLSEFLNGDWRARGCLQHYCYGSCCRNR